MTNEEILLPWMPMNTAPKDGRILRLMVNFEESPLDDENCPQATIGCNDFDHSGVDEWRIAGWSWTHDCFTDGVGTPIGWLPLLSNKLADPPDDQIIEIAQETERALPDDADAQQRLLAIVRAVIRTGY